MKYDVPSLLLILTVCFYTAGFFLIYEDKTYLPSNGIRQEHIVYTDNDGEEHEGDGLIEIEGIGSVLSYKDIYLSTLPFLIVSCILAKVVFNSTEEEKFMVYTNCILGLLLILLTNTSNILSTILYWLGIITASYATSYANKEKKHERK